MIITSCPIDILIFFSIIISISLFLDFFGHKYTTNMSMANSIAWSIFWFFLALVFYSILWWKFSKDWANLYLAGYLLEKCLAFDNLIIFMTIFSSFGVSRLLQRKILFWGIFGAIVFRGIFVFIGTRLFAANAWVELAFAIFIMWSAIKMLNAQKRSSLKQTPDFSRHWIIQVIGKIIPIYPKFYANNFFVSNKELLLNNMSSLVSRKGAFYVTPAFLCLMVIETSDVLFAFDSVPAIIAITEQPILVYTAIIFAILGLRSLYFVLQSLVEKLIYLEKTVIILLMFISLKMVLNFFNHSIYNTHIEISPLASLFIILLILLLGVVASLCNNKKSQKPI